METPFKRYACLLLNMLIHLGFHFYKTEIDSFLAVFGILVVSGSFCTNGFCKPGIFRVLSCLARCGWTFLGTFLPGDLAFCFSPGSSRLSCLGLLKG